MWPFKGNKRQNRLIYSSPSKRMEDALPIGCYEEGAFIMGGVGEECIKILHLNTLSSKTATLEEESLDKIDGEKNISAIKKELAMGNISVAENVIKNSFVQAGAKELETERVSFCNICVDYHVKNPVQDYRRVLDLSTGLMTVSFVDKFGTTFRDCFMSNDKIFCYRYYNNSPLEECDVRLRSKNENVHVYSKDNYLIFIKHLENHVYGFVLMAESERGSISGVNDKLRIKNARLFYLYGKSFDCESDEEKYVEKTMAELKSVRHKFDALYKESSYALSKYMSRSKIEFSERELENIDSELLRQRGNQISSEMIDIIFKYGKYLSYSLGAVALNTDDIFISKKICKTQQEKCEKINFKKIARVFTLDVLSSNFANISTFFEKLYEKISVFEKNALKIYNTEGIFIPCQSDDFGHPANFENANILNKNYTFLVGALCHLFITCCNINAKNCEKMKQILQKIANFYENTLVYNGSKKAFSSPFGISPYSYVDGEGHMICADCMTDFECSRYIFQCMERLSEENKERYKDLIEKIPDVVVDGGGAIKEFDGLQKNMPQSKSLSHLVPYSIGLRPMGSRKEYEELVSSSVKSRFVGAFGNLCSRDLVDMALALSCCSHGVDSMEILSLLIKTFLRENLIFSHYDLSNTAVGKCSECDFINIDVNTALSTCLQNIILNYVDGVLYLSNEYPKCFNSVVAYGIRLSKTLVCNVKINWKKGIIKLSITSSINDLLNIMLPLSYRRLKGIKKSVDRVDMSIKDITLVKNKPLKLTIFF